jgi:hypothetical protein
MKSKKHSIPTATTLVDPTVKSLVSLGIVIHLFCLAFVLSSNVNPSRLQERICSTLAVYTRTLHLEPGLVLFQFTDGTSLSDNHVLEFSPPDGKTLAAFPENESRWGLERQRFSAIAFEIASFAERDDIAGYYAKALGGRLLRETKQEHLRLNCIHKISQPLDLTMLDPKLPPEDPNAKEYYESVYEAEVWRDEDGELNVQKRSTGRDAAPSTPASSNDKNPQT